MTITYHVDGPSYSTDPTARALGSTFAMSTSLSHRDVSGGDVPRRDCAPVPLDLAGLYPNLFAAAETAHRPDRIAIALNELLTALKRLTAWAGKPQLVQPAGEYATIADIVTDAPLVTATALQST